MFAWFEKEVAERSGGTLSVKIAAWRRSLNWATSQAVILQTMNATATIFMIIVAAFVFIPFISSGGYGRSGSPCRS